MARRPTRDISEALNALTAVLLGDEDGISGAAYDALITLVDYTQGTQARESLANLVDACDDRFYIDGELAEVTALVNNREGIA